MTRNAQEWVFPTIPDFGCADDETITTNKKLTKGVAQWFSRRELQPKIYLCCVYLYIRCSSPWVKEWHRGC